MMLFQHFLFYLLLVMLISRSIHGDYIRHPSIPLLVGMMIDASSFKFAYTTSFSRIPCRDLYEAILSCYIESSCDRAVVRKAAVATERVRPTRLPVTIFGVKCPPKIPPINPLVAVMMIMALVSREVEKQCNNDRNY